MENVRINRGILLWLWELYQLSLEKRSLKNAVFTVNDKTYRKR